MRSHWTRSDSLLRNTDLTDQPIALRSRSFPRVRMKSTTRFSAGCADALTPELQNESLPTAATEIAD